MSPGIAFVATALAYATASLLFLAALLRGVEKAGRGARYVLFASVGLHAAYLAVDAFSATAPMGRVHSTLTYLSLGIIGAFLLAALKRPNISVLGAFITPIALFFFLGSGLGRSVEHVSPEARSFLLPLHIAANVLGLVAFALASGASAAYVLQERQLRKKRLGGIFQRLPALDVLDGFGLRAVSVGFVLLTVGIVTGAFFAYRVHQGSVVTTSQAFALIAWVLFAAVLLLRLAAGWRGRRAAIGTIVGFLCTAAVLVSYMVRAQGGPS